jgi:cytoskeletal protein CcmA (bactofilin family)
MAVKYSFKGSSNGLNPPLVLVKGVTYTFNVNTPGHPFWIKTSPVTGTTGVYSNGVTNNGASSGIITFVVPQNAPNILYYISQNDAQLVNEIFVVSSTISIIGDPYIQGNARVSGSIGISGSLNISGSQTLSGSLFVTGSQIITGSSNISGSTFLTGSARITGSQLITGSSNVSGSTFLTGSSNISGSTFLTGSAFITGALAVSGSTSLSGSVNIFGSGSVSGSWTVTGDITARQIIISSSIIYVTESYADGSHKFGNTQDDTHQFTGILSINGIAIGAAAINDFTAFNICAPS